MTMSNPDGCCADCINRRQFLTTAGAAGLGGLVVLSGCGDGDLGLVFATLPAGPITINVADYPQLATVGTLVKVNGEFIAVKRTGTSTFDALSLVCTHQGCGVTITSNTQLDCPCHGSRFDGNGLVVRDPADKPLPKFPTSYDAAANTLTIG